MRALFIGDIVGSPGRQIVQERLADLVKQRQIDLVIANGENSASGFGITPRLAEDLLGTGIDHEADFNEIARSRHLSVSTRIMSIPPFGSMPEPR